MTTTIKQGVTCQVCNRQRSPSEIDLRESSLLKGKKILICSKCEAGKKEPRAFVIIVALRFGIERVADYIVNHRYEGSVITGAELLGKKR